MRFIGYTPEPYQREVHNAIQEHPTASVFVVCSPRQVGKTTMLENEILRSSLNNKNAVSLCISLTLDGSRKIYRDIVQATEGSGAIKKKNDSLLTIEFITGSLVYFRSAQMADSLRGITIKNGGMLFIDEASYVDTDMFFGVLLPMTNVFRANILLTSTPRFKTGFFYTYYMKGKNGDPGIYAFDFTDYDLSKFLPEDLLAQYKQVMPKNQFQSEYLGKFLDGSSVLFEGYKERIREEEMEKTSTMYMGIDWGTGQEQDRTAISIINSKGQQVYTESFNDKNTTQTVERVEKIWREYGKPNIMAEKNGVGKPYCDLLKEKKIPVEEWITTNQSKNDLVKHLQVAFEQGTIVLRGDTRQMDELSYYEAAYNPKTGNVSYNAPKGLHDDTVIALMLSWEAYLTRVTRGIYCLGKA